MDINNVGLRIDIDEKLIFPDWTDVQTRAYMPDPADVPCRAVGFAIQTQ